MIRHKLFAGKKTNDRLPVINELKEQDYYDVVFVVMQCTQIGSILPILQQNVSRNIILVEKSRSVYYALCCIGILCRLQL